MRILSSFDAYEHLRTKMTSDVEEFWAIALRIDQSVISSDCIFRGTVDACPVHPRDVFRYACLRNASRILLAHNHPTGDPQPSAADLATTKRLVQASRLLQIPIVDHIILGRDRYTSFADLGLLGRRRPSARRQVNGSFRVDRVPSVRFGECAEVDDD